MIEYGGNANAVSVLRSNSHSHSESNEDEDFSVNEYHADHESQSMDSSVIDVFNTATTAVTMTNSSHVQIKPVTQINGPVTIHHYSSIESREEPEPNVTLTMSRKKICYDMVSNLTWKAGIIFALIVALIVVVIIILNFTVLRQDSGQDTLPTKKPTEPSSTDWGTDLGDDIYIFTKKRWVGQEIVNQNGILAHPIPLVIIGHTAGGKCTTIENCTVKVRDIQSYVVEGGKWSDIPYNFLIAGDGNVYETLGWDNQNPRRNNSLWISFVGNYVYYGLNKKQEKALQLLLEKGIELGKLDNNYLMIAHRQLIFENTLSPGKNIVEAMKQWPHYDNRTYT